MAQLYIPVTITASLSRKRENEEKQAGKKRATDLLWNESVAQPRGLSILLEPAAGHSPKPLLRLSGGCFLAGLPGKIMYV